MALTKDQMARINAYNAQFEDEKKSDLHGEKNAELSSKPAFEQALDAKQPIEIRPDPPEKVKGQAFAPDLERAFPHVERTHPKFNDAVQSASTEPKEKPQSLEQPPEKVKGQAFAPDLERAFPHVERTHPKFNDAVHNISVQKGEEKSDFYSEENGQSIQPDFKKALDAKEPIEIRPAPPEKVKGQAFAPDLERAFPHVERTHPKFNDAVHNVSHETYEGRNSSMVEKEKPQSLNQPPEGMRAAPNRKKHNKAMQEERNEVAQFEEDQAKMAAIRALEKDAPQQSMGRRM